MSKIIMQLQKEFCNCIMIFDIGTSFAEHHTGRGTGFQKMFLFDFAKEKQPPGVDGCFFMTAAERFGADGWPV